MLPVKRVVVIMWAKKM